MPSSSCRSSGCPARIEEGELIFDPFFDLGLDAEPGAAAALNPELAELWDEKCRGIIINYVREYGDLEYVNVGRVVDSLSKREITFGRRDVYIAVLKRRASPSEVVNIIRVQKWGVSEHLDEGHDLLDAMVRAEDYTDYIFDRRMGCRQLSMNLCPKVTARKLTEKYDGRNAAYRGLTIRSTYFQRDYIRGVASDKIPQRRFAAPAYALAFARLLGQAAAVNMIVGRFGLAGHVLFDDGDELIIEGPDGLPLDIVVADLTGTFAHYEGQLAETAEAYAAPILERLKLVAAPEAFINAYLDAFEERLSGRAAGIRPAAAGLRHALRLPRPGRAGQLPLPLAACWTAWPRPTPGSSKSASARSSTAACEPPPRAGRRSAAF